MRMLPFLLLAFLASGLVGKEVPLTFQVYKGTLGPHPVLAELAKAPDGRILGRYCYLKNGVDLFLVGHRGKAGGIRLEEPRTGPEEEGSIVTCTGVWRITSLDRVLAGTWTGQRGGRPLALKLGRVAR